MNCLFKSITLRRYKNMAKRRQERAQSPQRPVDLDTLKAFWDIMSQHFGNMPIDLSLFNYKTEAEKRPLVRQAVREKVPMTQAYEVVLELLDEYHKGEDILWRPSKAYYSGADWTSMLWLDDFKLDNDLGLVPFFYIQTSLGKYQAFFKLRSPVLVEKADEIQKTLARLTGDKGAGSFFQHRRMPGLANGKYEDDPVCVFFGIDDKGYIDPTVLIEMIEKINPPQGAGGVASITSGTMDTPEIDRKGLPEDRMPFRPVVDIGKGYKTLYVKKREAFLKFRDDGTIDESATDMAWMTYLARRGISAGWDEGTLALSLFVHLRENSPELERRKKTKNHAREYAFRTILKAIDLVKNTPLEDDEDIVLDF
jgi:hypothetical protein